MSLTTNLLNRLRSLPGVLSGMRLCLKPCNSGVLSVMSAVVLTIVLILPVQPVQSQTIPVNLKVYFRQSITYLEPAFRDNAWRLDNFVTTIQNAVSDSTYTVQEIVIRSGASPEGPFDNNLRLSQDRGISVRDYLKRELNIHDSLFTLQPMGEDWEGLRRLVEQYPVPNKAKVLKIIDDYLANDVKTQRLSALSKMAIGDIDNGKTTNYLYDNIYPELRSASNAVVCYLKPVERKPVVQGTGIKDTVVMVMQNCPDGAVGAGGMGYPGAGYPGVAAGSLVKVKKDRTYQFGVKTNLLFDLTSSLNVELEFPMKNRVSLLLEHSFPWWLPVYKEKYYSLELLRSGLELRYWFGDRTERKVLEGWFIGAYGCADYFDFEWQNKGWQGETYFDCGLSMGYSFFLAKNWRMETSLGVGYLQTKYTEYDHRLDLGLLIYQKDDVFTWIGPTKLKCSLTWMLPTRNKKGDDTAKRAAKAAKYEFVGNISAPASTQEYVHFETQEPETLSELDDTEPQPSQDPEPTDRKAKKAAAKQAKADAKAAAAQAKADAKQAEIDNKVNAKQAKADAKAAAKQAKVDAKAAAEQSKTDAAQAKTDEKAAAKQAKIDAKAAAKQAKVDAKAAAEQSKTDAAQAKTDAKAAAAQAKTDEKAAAVKAKEDAARAKKDEKARAAQAKTDAKAAAVQAKTDEKAAAVKAKEDAAQAKKDDKARDKQAKKDAAQAKIDAKARAEQAKKDEKARAAQAKTDAKAAAAQAKIDEKARAAQAKKDEQARKEKEKLDEQARKEKEKQEKKDAKKNNKE